MSPASRTCERARAWSSRQLDGELSEIETAILHRHLRHCEQCAAFVANTARVTQSLRQAPLEPVAFEIAVARRRRHPRALRSASGLAAACVVLAAAGITVSREFRYRAPSDLPRTPTAQVDSTEQPRLRSQASSPGGLGFPLPVGQRSAKDDFLS